MKTPTRTARPQLWNVLVLGTAVAQVICAAAPIRAAGAAEPGEPQVGQSDHADEEQTQSSPADVKQSKKLPEPVEQSVRRMESLVEDLTESEGSSLPVNKEFWADVAKFNEFMEAQEPGKPRTRELMAEISNRLIRKLNESPGSRQALYKFLEDFSAEVPTFAPTKDLRFIWALIKLLKNLQSLPHDLTPQTVEGEFTPDAARAILPRAAGVTRRDWAVLLMLGAVECESLSAVLHSLEPSEAAQENPDVLKDFRYLTEAPDGKRYKIDEALRQALRQSFPQGYMTFLQPEFVTDVTADLDADAARGTVCFRAPGLYQGRVEYVARKTTDGWRIEEFHLPNYEIRVLRGENGMWQMDQ